MFRYTLDGAHFIVSTLQSLEIIIIFKTRENTCVNYDLLVRV